jgi:hypothetical protein
VKRFQYDLSNVQTTSECSDKKGGLVETSMDHPIDELDFDEFGPPRKLMPTQDTNVDSFNSFKQNGSQISEAALQ